MQTFDYRPDRKALTAPVNALKRLAWAIRAEQPAFSTSKTLLEAELDALETATTRYLALLSAAIAPSYDQPTTILTDMRLALPPLTSQLLKAMAIVFGASKKRYSRLIGPQLLDAVDAIREFSQATGFSSGNVHAQDLKLMAAILPLQNVCHEISTRLDADPFVRDCHRSLLPHLVDVDRQGPLLVLLIKNIRNSDISSPVDREQAMFRVRQLVATADLLKSVRGFGELRMPLAEVRRTCRFWIKEERGNNHGQRQPRR